MSEAPSSTVSPVTSAIAAAVVSSLATMSAMTPAKTTVKQQVITAAAYFDASVTIPTPAPVLDGGAR